jgi:hypothetical protein
MSETPTSPPILPCCLAKVNKLDANAGQGESPYLPAMSDAHDQLGQFLDARFPGLTFPALTDRHGAFPSLRFELGGELPHDIDDESDKRVDRAAAAAASVFEAAFAPDDDGFVSFIRWTEQDDDLFRALLPPGCDITRTEDEDFYEQNEADTP